VLKIHLEASGEVLSVLGQLLQLIQTPTEPSPATTTTEPPPATTTTEPPPAEPAPPPWQIKQEQEIEQGRLVARQLIEAFSGVEGDEQADLIRRVSAGPGWRPLVLFLTSHPSKSTSQALIDQGAEKELADRITLIGSALQILPPYWD